MVDVEQSRVDHVARHIPLPIGQFRWLLVILTLPVVALLVWFWTGRLPAEGRPEVTFARDMSAHHEQAVEMSLMIRDRSADAEIRQFALDIAMTQQAQIGQMHGWLAVWNVTIAGAQPPMMGHGELMGMATQQQMNSLQALPVPEAEIAFLQLMIRHHQGGIAMAEAALQQSRRPEVTRLATTMVQGQQSEIAYMQDLLAQRGAEPLAPLAPMDMSEMHR
jgi:uncharacterized protein (DUF305 family)